MNARKDDWEYAKENSDGKFLHACIIIRQIRVKKKVLSVWVCFRNL
jgi:hypothetical protein